MMMGLKPFFCLGLLLAVAIPLRAGTNALIRCAPGWKAELIGETPAITYPSMVCCSPDGRVFLGRDPDDMSAPSDSTSDSILSIYPHGEIMTFATNLHAVFGLQYIDGKLYVHHSPMFSVFDDKYGIGVNRVDLIKNDNLHPWDPSFNDHIPSNCHLAMDGYLYISTGDKGVYGAVGTDGRKIEIHGGGIYRMRPSGKELEVYSTGTRNHLDIAINSEDEMFTYDNTDDGVGWWTRVTHMVDGGYYGYPYDYKPQRPYTLWMMCDYGGGAPTGACAYNEDALPDEYKGNLFVCDWGRGQVLRLKVQRQGATYKVAERIQDDKLDFITKGGMDHFFPIGICVTPDGKGFYVADWGKGTWRHPDVIGRFYKVTYTGKTHETPKPDWFIPAGTGQPFEATTDELIKGLSHPAESVRLVAQRRLAERKDAPRKLMALLKDTTAAAWARWSAIWTLDAIDGGTKARKTIIAALNDKDPTVQMQAERELGTRRVKQAAKPLIALLQSTNAAVRFRAATALGRIGDPSAVPALIQKLDEPDLFAHYADFLALRRIGLADPASWPRIVAGFGSDDPLIRQGVYFAVRETYDPELVKALAAEAARHDLSVSARTNIFDLLSTLSLQRPPWKGEWWNTTPANGKPAAKIDKWAGTAIVDAALRDAVQDPQPLVRAIGLEWLRTSHDTNAVKELAKMFQRDTNVAVRASIVLALPSTPTEASRGIINSIFKDPNPPPALLQAAIEVAGKNPGVEWDSDLIRIAQRTQDEVLLETLLDIFGRKKLAAAIPIATAGLAKTNATVRKSAFEALQKIGGQAAIDAVATMLNNPQADIRRQAITALGAMKAKSTIPLLLPLIKEADVSDGAIGALAQMGDVAAFDAYMEGLASKNASLRTQCETALKGIRAQAFPKVEARLTKGDLPATALASLKQIYTGDATAKQSSVFRHKVLDVPPDQYAEFALSHPGDSRRGKKIFHNLQGVGCVRCHRIAGEGGNIGPDLADIRAKYPRSDIIESVVYPSKRILDGYQQVFFQTRDDDEISGIVRSETPAEVTIIDSAGLTHIVETTNIISRKTSKISLMPEGLQDGLSLVEFSDLIAYVENPNVPEPPAPSIARPRPRGPSEKGEEPILTASQDVPPPDDLNAEDLFSPFSTEALTPHSPPPHPHPHLPRPKLMPPAASRETVPTPAPPSPANPAPAAAAPSPGRTSTPDSEPPDPGPPPLPPPPE
jgi:putative heme-binding domain-containing protein